MNELIRHIEYLLVSNDCVVIPSLGAVLAHDMPARYDREQHTMLPPSRTFSFNASLDHNDGMLVTSVARSKSVSFEVARSIVGAEVDAMKRILASDGFLTLGAAGVLRMSAEGVMSFEPGRVSALSPRYMWLPSLELCPVTELARRRQLSLEDNQRVGHRPSPVRYIYRAARVAASLALLLALGFVLTTPIRFDKAQYASLGIENFSPAPSPSAEPDIVRHPGQSSAPVTLYLRAYDDASEQVDTAARAAYQRSRRATANVSQIRFDSSDRYYLIIASLASQADADDFVSFHKNQQLGILAKDGRYRVYAATGATLRDAQSAAAALSDRYPDVWVCRK